MSNSEKNNSSLFDVLLIRYGEIALKSQQVRKRLLRNLIRNIRFQCKRDGIKFTRLWRDHGFIYLHPEPESMDAAIETLKKVFGIHSISPSIYEQGDFQDVQRIALVLARKILCENSTFGIRARRTGDHSFSSGDLANSIGARIIEELGERLKLKVNLSNPDTWIHINVRDKNIFVYTESIDTPWEGNPLEPFASGGISLISGHISEFVSTMLTMRRGMHILPIIFSENPTKDVSIHTILQKIKEYLPIRSLYYFKLDMESILARFKDLAEQFHYFPLQYILYRRFRILLGEWMVNNSKSLFELLDAMHRLDWKSNIASYISSKQQKSQNAAKRRKFIEYVAIIEGNFPFSYYSQKIPLFNRIESSRIPIFRGAIGLSQDENWNKFQQISGDIEDHSEILYDYPEISTSKDGVTTSTGNISHYPFNPHVRDDLPDEVIQHFEKIWIRMGNELNQILKDLDLYGEPSIGSTKRLKLVQL
ncbi:MAG: hypothetical protein JW776_07900 [Candidatus Lokiarchaeota archaeon]|nr:hypothetical protein [Candidatus Lokiarchaeota archaeon]